MKTMLATLCVAFFSATVGFSQLTLNSGESYIYEFDTLPYQRTQLNGPVGGQFGLYLGGGSLEPGESLRFEIFETATSHTPIYVGTLDSTSSSFAFQHSAIGLWYDLQGAIRLTSLSGEVEVSSFTMTVGRPASMSSGLTDVFHASVVPVPEPATLALFLAGGVLAYGFSARTRKR